MTSTTPGTSTDRRFLRRRRRIIGGAALGVVAVLVLVGLASTADGYDRTPDLTGRTFVSVATHGHDLVDGSRIRITFDEGHLSARAGCNTMMGGATWTDGVLDAPGLASTMRACASGLMAQDAWLGDLLASRPAVTLEGTVLTIGDATTGVVLVEAGA